MIRCINVAASQAESYYQPRRLLHPGASASFLARQGRDSAGHLREQRRPPVWRSVARQAAKRRRNTGRARRQAPRRYRSDDLSPEERQHRRSGLWRCTCHRRAQRGRQGCPGCRRKSVSRPACWRPDGKTITVDTGNLIARTVLHDTSRAADPNLHTHCLLINATQTVDGRWRAMENRQLFKMQRELDVHYKSELAVRLAELGYQLRHTKNGFELAIVSDQQIKTFSTRTAAIDAALAARGLTREEASAEMRNKAALDTRDRKMHYDRDLLLSAWCERAAELGLVVSLAVRSVAWTVTRPERSGSGGD